MPTPIPLDRPEEERSLERYLMTGLVLMIGLIVAFPLYRASEPERRAHALKTMTQENIALGQEAYSLHCAGCHGDTARGGRGMPTLRSKEFLGSVSDDQIKWLIAGGIPGTTMSAYDLDLGGPFTTQETLRVVAYLRSLEENAPSVPSWRQGTLAEVVVPPPTEAAVIAPPEDGPSPSSTPPSPPAPSLPTAPPPMASRPTASEQDRPNAAARFAMFCVACHGADGKGTPIGPAIRPPTPTLADDLEALIAVIARGRPGTAMPGFAKHAGGPLDAEQVSELAGWLLE